MIRKTIDENKNETKTAVVVVVVATPTTIIKMVSLPNPKSQIQTTIEKANTEKYKSMIIKDVILKTKSKCKIHGHYIPFSSHYI